MLLAEERLRALTFHRSIASPLGAPAGGGVAGCPSFGTVEEISRTVVYLAECRGRVPRQGRSDAHGRSAPNPSHGR